MCARSRAGPRAWPGYRIGRAPRHFPRIFLVLLGIVSLCDCLGRWEVIRSSEDVTYSPFPVPKRGLRARLQRATTTRGAEEGGRRAPPGAAD